MAYKYKKPYRIKKKKSILRNRFFWVVVLLLLGAGSLVYILFFSWVFQIKEVTLSGTNGISQADLRHFFLDKNIFLLNKEEIKKNILEGFSKITEVKISRNFPSSLDVEIKERVAVAVWCNQEEECFLMDQTGAIFEEACLEQVDLPVFFGEKDILTDEIISQILEINAKFNKDLDVEIEKITIISYQRLDVKTAEGWEVYFDPQKDIAWQLIQLHLVLERQITSEERKGLEYINLRFEKVYYK